MVETKNNHLRTLTFCYQTTTTPVGGKEKKTRRKERYENTMDEYHCWEKKRKNILYTTCSTCSIDRNKCR